MIFNMIAGGGGSGGLNFSVASYASESLLPATASENDIAIITDTSISSWTMSRTEPQGTEGMVWISIGDSSQVAFNLLTENTIYVYPIRAYQYIDSTWVAKDAKSYQNQDGSFKWVDWINSYLFYEEGNQQESVTGGWTTSGWTYGGAYMLNASIAETYMQVIGAYDSGNTGASVVGTVNKINVDNLQYINANIQIVQSGVVNFGLCSSSNAQSLAINSQTISTGTYTKSLDVSTLTGDYYITFSAAGSAASGGAPSAKITKVWAG